MSDRADRLSDTPPREASLLAAFTDHPRALGATYFQHHRQAFGFAARLIAAGLAALVHGLAPWLFEHTASRAVRRLHAELSRRSGDAWD